MQIQGNPIHVNQRVFMFYPSCKYQCAFGTLHMITWSFAYWLLWYNDIKGYNSFWTNALENLLWKQKMRQLLFISSNGLSRAKYSKYQWQLSAYHPIYILSIIKHLCLVNIVFFLAPWLSTYTIIKWSPSSGWLIQLVTPLKKYEKIWVRKLAL